MGSSWSSRNASRPSALCLAPSLRASGSMCASTATKVYTCSMQHWSAPDVSALDNSAPHAHQTWKSTPNSIVRQTCVTMASQSK
jgi:hypothetical protein